MDGSGVGLEVRTGSEVSDEAAVGSLVAVSALENKGWQAVIKATGIRMIINAMRWGMASNDSSITNYGIIATDGGAMHARRALLYMPGDDRHKIEKAITLDVDCICMDMEDGVAPSHKAEARLTIAAALKELTFGPSEKLVRINAVGSGLETDDIQAVLPYRPDGIVLPKVEALEHLQWAGAMIETAELAHGWPVNSIRLLADVETARGILNLKEIASHSRLDGLIFGGEDYAASIGATRTPEAMELFYARSAVVIACAAYGLQAIDMVNVDFHDLEKLRLEASFGAQLGYTGKQVIHPAQVQPVQEAFTPPADAIDAARRLVQSFEASQADGRGAFALDGRMIDMPLVRAAQNVLARANAAGKN
jgi:citrate lyase beta subunit